MKGKKETLLRKMYQPLDVDGFTCTIVNPFGDNEIIWYKVQDNLILSSWGYILTHSSGTMNVLIKPLFCKLELLKGIMPDIYSNASGYADLANRYGMTPPSKYQESAFLHAPGETEGSQMYDFIVNSGRNCVSVYQRCFEEASDLSSLIGISKLLYSKFPTIDSEYNCSTFLRDEVLLSLLYMRRFDEAEQEIEAAVLREEAYYHQTMESFEKMHIEYRRKVAIEAPSRTEYFRYQLWHEADARNWSEQRFGELPKRRLDFYLNLVRKKDCEGIDGILQMNYEKNVQDLITLGVLPANTSKTLQPFANKK